MSTRFVTNAIIAVAAGFVVVATQSFSSSTASWIAFGIAIGILALAGLAQVDASRGDVQRILDGIVAIVAAWTIVASVVFDGTTSKWLSLGEGLALVGLALVGLTNNEIREQTAVRVSSDTSMRDSLRTAA